MTSGVVVMSQMTMLQTGNTVTATLCIYDDNASMYDRSGSDTETLNGKAITFTFKSTFKFVLTGAFHGMTFSGQDRVTGSGVDEAGPFSSSQISTTPPGNQVGGIVKKALLGTLRQALVEASALGAAVGQQTVLGFGHGHFPWWNRPGGCPAFLYCPVVRRVVRSC